MAGAKPSLGPRALHGGTLSHREDWWRSRRVRRALPSARSATEEEARSS